jgi:hypothetical protein
VFTRKECSPTLRQSASSARGPPRKGSSSPSSRSLATLS